jgi:outer membrane receptor protein involved in Fe transport
VARPIPDGISAFSTFETGQPFLAASAISRTLASSAPGTLATVSSSTAVMSAPFEVSRVTVALVETDSGVSPAFASSFEKAME